MTIGWMRTDVAGPGRWGRGTGLASTRPGAAGSRAAGAGPGRGAARGGAVGPPGCPDAGAAVDRAAAGDDGPARRPTAADDRPGIGRHALVRRRAAGRGGLLRPRRGTPGPHRGGRGSPRCWRPTWSPRARIRRPGTRGRVPAAGRRGRDRPGRRDAPHDPGRSSRSSSGGSTRSGPDYQAILKRSGDNPAVEEALRDRLARVTRHEQAAAAAREFQEVLARSRRRDVQVARLQQRLAAVDRPRTLTYHAIGLSSSRPPA